MKVGIIGLGRMGEGMSRRMMKSGIQVFGYRRNYTQALNTFQKGYINGVSESIKDLVAIVKQGQTHGIFQLVVPAASVDETLNQLLPFLSAGDIIIDHGNSNFKDSKYRAEKLYSEYGIEYLDCGTSGGVYGVDRGFCLMVGGKNFTVSYCSPIFDALSPDISSVERTNTSSTITPAENGWLHCGPSGAGHFVKMVHNGIEYGIMQSYAEGFNILKSANKGKEFVENDAETAPMSDPQNYQYDIDVAEVAELWRRGSVVGSWLLDLTASVLRGDENLDEFSGSVSDSGEGRWTVSAAVDLGVPAPCITSSLYSRFDSRNLGTFANKILSGMRYMFGGHNER
jgi:6-phosphogluconate dehydrogenase